jgi:hypothetical protein
VSRLALALGWVAFLLQATGCSPAPKLVNAKGQLTYKNKPYIVSSKIGVDLYFIPVVEAGAKADSYAHVGIYNNEDGTFVVQGKDLKGIPAGKYRIAVQQMMIGSPSAEVQIMNDKFSKENTAVVRDITNEEPVVIELSKSEG